MKLLGILPYCVHWGKSNFTRPVLMSVLDSFGKRPRDGRGRKKEHKEEKRSNEFTRSGWARGPRKSDSAVSVPGFPMNDCGFLCRDRSLYRKLNHVSGQAHMVVSTSAGLGKGRQRASDDKTPRTGPRWSGPVRALSLKNSSWKFDQIQAFL